MRFLLALLLMVPALAQEPAALSPAAGYRPGNGCRLRAAPAPAGQRPVAGARQPGVDYAAASIWDTAS